MKNTTIINEANKILQSLQKLQTRCNNLIYNVSAKRDWLPPHIQNVIDTIDELANFDLEDSIVNAYDYEGDK